MKFAAECLKLVKVKHPDGLAGLCETGDGVECDEQTAFALYKEVYDDLKSGNSGAGKYGDDADIDEVAKALARMYRDGRGTEKNVEHAVSLMRGVLKRQLPAAGIVNGGELKSIGWLEVGKRCEYDEERIDLAENCYLQGCHDGDAECMFALAWLMEKGYPDLETEIDDAADWLQTAAKMGHVRSMTMFGHWLCNARLEKFLRGKRVCDVAALAHKWLNAAAEKGDPEAQYFLGREYARGIVVEKSYDGAVNWLRQSAEAGLSTAQLYLGDFYYGAGNFPGAFRVYDELREKVSSPDFEPDEFYESDESPIEDDGRVEARLAYLYKNGFGVKVDAAKAAELQQLAEKKSGPHPELLDPKSFLEDQSISFATVPMYNCYQEYAPGMQS